MSAPENILEIRDLHTWFRTYQGTAKVLDGVNLTVRRGERLGLVGETGCGKTTTLKAVMGILPREASVPRGTILFEGKDILKMNARDLARFRRYGASMIFQDPTAALNPVFTLGQFLADVIGTRTASREEIAARSEAALRDVRLPDPPRMLKTYPFELSGGMRQRACIGIAISGERKLLLADEPGTSLDVTIQDQVLRLITQLVDEKGLSVLLVSHSMGVVRETTDRVCVMYAGTIVEEATSDRLFANPCHPYTVALLRCVPKLSGTGISRGIPGTMPSYLNPPPGCRFAPRCQEALPACATEKPELREVEPGHRVACLLHSQSGQSPRGGESNGQ